MMKRFLTAALAVILTLSLAACGDNNSANLPKPNASGDNTILGSDFQKDMNQSKAFHIYDHTFPLRFKAQNSMKLNCH